MNPQQTQQNPLSGILPMLMSSGNPYAMAAGALGTLLGLGGGGQAAPPQQMEVSRGSGTQLGPTSQLATDEVSKPAEVKPEEKQDPAPQNGPAPTAPVSTGQPAQPQPQQAPVEKNAPPTNPTSLPHEAQHQQPAPAPSPYPDILAEVQKLLAASGAQAGSSASQFLGGGGY